MSLQKKLTLIITSITLAVLVLSLSTLYILQVRSTLNAAKANARSSVSICVRNLQYSIQQSGNYQHETTYLAIVKYQFRSQVDILQNETTFYSLSKDGEYLYNQSSYDPMRYFQFAPSDYEAKTKIYSSGGHVLLVAAQPFNSTNEDYNYIVYLTQDITALQYRNTLLFWGMLSVLLIACIIVILSVSLIIRKILRPIEVLTTTASKIANGSYSDRTSHHSSDEIGQLSKAFDHMADMVEDTIGTLNEQLEQRELLLGALTHELKTPMTSIIGYADSLLHMPLSLDQQHLCADRIYQNGRRTELLSQKMMELISLSKTNSIEMKEFEISELLTMLEDTLHPRVQIQVKTNRLYGDPILLYSLIRNLTDNAAKASPENTSIDVVIESNSITVTDKGHGIPLEHLPYVTEPFYRVDKARSREQGGAGLGLALCKMIAKKHGGYLEIAYSSPQGTKIIAHLQLDNNSGTNRGGLLPSA